jgi:hypothetical protein
MRKGIALMLVALVVLMITVVVVSGCGGVSPQEAATKFKADLQNLSTAMQGLLSPGNYTSVDNFKSAWKNVEKAYNDAVKSAKDVKDTNISALKKAWNDLSTAIGGITSVQSLTQKADAITKGLQEFETALQRLSATLNPSQ